MTFTAKIPSLFTALAIGLLTSVSAWAETHTYEATIDFTDIDAGDVPYYRHNGVNALAINAAIENYRDKFARATLEFTHETGLYDVTVTSLGETDGDGIFRFLVDGELVGSSVNEPATEDYGNQLHRFENITITQGALIGVESIAVSNGLIPEGDAFAYARGRWTTLTIETADDDTPDPVQTTDLVIDIGVDNSQVETGETVEYTATVENTSDAVIATNPQVIVTLPESFTNINSADCLPTANALILSCEAAELQPGATANFLITAAVALAGDYTVTAAVSTDQPDPVAANNQATVTTTVLDPVAEPVDPPLDGTTSNTPITVDLDLAIEADQSHVVVGDVINYTITLNNLSTTNTATTPTVGVLLPESMLFQASDLCTADEQAVICKTEELPPGAGTSVSFTALAESVNTYSELFVTASSTQAEYDSSNNEVQLVTVISRVPITAIQPATTTDTADQPVTETATSAKTQDNGGGAMNTSLLLLLLVSCTYGVYRRLQLTTR